MTRQSTKSSQDYKKLNPDEKEFVYEHPLAARSFYDDSRTAISETAKRFSSGFHNGKADAFRHAFWSALMTKHMGESLAKKYGDAHEALPPAVQPTPEKEMDLHNNEIGRSIAIKNPQASDGELADAVEAAIKRHQLKWLAE